MYSLASEMQPCLSVKPDVCPTIFSSMNRGTQHLLLRATQFEDNGIHSVALTRTVADGEQFRHWMRTEFLLIGCRTHPSSYLNPFSWATSGTAKDYLEMQFKRSTAELAGMLLELKMVLLT